MEIGHSRNRNQAPIPVPIPTMPPRYPVTNGADGINLFHRSVTKNPNISFTSENHHHLTNPNNPNHQHQILLDSNASLLRSSAPSSSMAAMREMIFHKAALQPINTDQADAVKIPKRKNVRISKDPQSVAARHRRERVSERIRILQRMVPGGMKMDTGSMLDEAIRYVKFLKRLVKCLEKVRPVQHGRGYGGRIGLGFAGPDAEEEVWGYHDYMASCMEMGDVLGTQGQSSS